MAEELGPLYAEIQYTSRGHNHTSRFSLNWVGELMPSIGQDPTLVTKGGEEILASVAMNAYADVLKGMFGSDAAIDAYDIFWYMPSTGESMWIYGGAIQSASGGRQDTGVLAGQLVFTLRCDTGRMLRLSLIETPDAVDQVYSASEIEANATYKALADYLTGDDNVITARGGGFPVAAYRMTTKTNDVLRRRFKV